MAAKYPDITEGIVLSGFSTSSTFLPYFQADANLKQARLKQQECLKNNRTLAIHLQN